MSQDPLPLAEAAPLRLRIVGVTACIAGASPRIRADLFALLRPFVLSDMQDSADADDTSDTPEVEITLRQAPARSEWQVWIGERQVFASGAHDRLLRHLEWLVVAQAAPRSSRWVVWHAASLVWEGRAVTLVGESSAGKSTLAVGLMARGWRPLADDLTLYDPLTHALAPFPRCFHVSPASMSPYDALAASAHPLIWPTPALPDYARPTRWADAGATPAWVVVVRRDTSQPTRLTPISQAQAAGALFAATIQTQAPVSVASVAASMAGGALGCWELNNNDLEATLDALTALRLTPSARVLGASSASNASNASSRPPGAT